MVAYSLGTVRGLKILKDAEGKKATMHDLYAHDDFSCGCRVSGFERDLFFDITSANGSQVFQILRDSPHVCCFCLCWGPVGV